eukprot:s1418_g2.t1
MTSCRAPGWLVMPVILSPQTTCEEQPQTTQAIVSAAATETVLQLPFREQTSYSADAVEGAQLACITELWRLWHDNWRRCLKDAPDHLHKCS